MQTFAFYILPHTAMSGYVEIQHQGEAGICQLHASLSYTMDCMCCHCVCIIMCISPLGCTVNKITTLQYRACWWLGDVRSQAIRRHVLLNSVLQQYNQNSVEIWFKSKYCNPQLLPNQQTLQKILHKVRILPWSVQSYRRVCWRMLRTDFLYSSAFQVCLCNSVVSTEWCVGITMYPLFPCCKRCIHVGTHIYTCSHIYCIPHLWNVYTQ